MAPKKPRAAFEERSCLALPRETVSSARARRAWPRKNRVPHSRSGRAGRGPEKTGFVDAGAPGVAPSSGLVFDRTNSARPSRGWPRAADCSPVMENNLCGLPGVGPELVDVC